MHFAPPPPRCPECHSLKSVKRGIRKTKAAPRQLYKCKKCGRHFSLAPLPGYNYPVRAVLTAPVLYYTGYSLPKVRQHIAARYHLDPSVSTVHSWIKRFGKYAGLKKERTQMIKAYTPRRLIYKKAVAPAQSFNLRVHQYKLDHCTDKAPGIRRYLTSLMEGKLVIKREWLALNASQVELGLSLPVYKPDDTYVAKMTDLALKLSWSNYQRHGLLEHFFLVMDSATIACEVPVYLTGKETRSILGMKGGLSGYIDMLQVRDKKVYITDYKPASHLGKNAVDQLLVYSLAL